MKLFVFLAAVCLASVSFATSVTQTTWTGGMGYLGPYNNWDGGTFYQSSNISWNQIPGILQINRLDDYEHIVASSYLGASSVMAADLNGDGITDLLGSAAVSDKIRWWENLGGTGTYWVQHPVDDNFDSASSVYATDINGDGDIDVVGAAGGAHDVKWWENATGSGLSWIEHQVDLSFYGATSVYAEDMDGDGDQDILGSAYNVDLISWWENMDGSGQSWTEHVVFNNFDGASSVFAADIDGDGDMDVLGASQRGNTIFWWENKNGSGTSWQGRAIETGYSGASSVFAADLNGDGDMDVIGAASTGNLVSWWENNGSGTSWISRQIESDFDGATSIYSTDMDNDGDMDVMGGARNTGEVTWWENSNGAGSSWITHEIDQEFDEVSCVYAGDLNDDGVMDAIGSAFGSDYISWWGGFEATGMLESSILNTLAVPLWGWIDWTCTNEPGTSVSFQVRASDDNYNMGEWSDIIEEPGNLGGILYNGDQYVQYRAILTSDDNNLTPTLEDVTISWNLQGIGEEDPAGYSLMPFSPNPMQSNIIIGYTVPGESIVQLSIYDVSGRMVKHFDEMESPSGYNQVTIDELDSGLYFCRMISGDFTATRQFVVIQ